MKMSIKVNCLSLEDRDLLGNAVMIFNFMDSFILILCMCFAELHESVGALKKNTVDHWIGK